MEEWVEVNGARIERTFFDENVLEARSYTWKQEELPACSEHVHCIICGIAIGSITASTIYWKSAGGPVCSYCYPRFVLPSVPESPQGAR